ncbi:MAG: hypothetical protein ABI723_03910 [Bacteroidia bacterium]
MKHQKKPLLSLAVLTGLSFLFLFSFYGENLKHPNKYLFTDSGDGLKAFYVFDYHVFNDTSGTNTQAVNYPYGEVHVFSDGQTAIANSFRLIDPVFPKLKNYSIAFLNALMLFSYLFCFILIFLILNKLSVPDNLSIAGALAIGILSPQVFRFLGHPSLSYCFMIPLTWYLQILFFEKENKWFYTTLIMLLLLVSPFIHGYYILIGGLFIFLNWLIKILQLHNMKFFKATLPHIIVQFIIPVMFFQLYMKIFDHHSGRSTDPYGLLVFNANFSTVFVPNHPPFDKVFQYFHPFQYQNWEGWAYIGLPMLFIVAFSVFKIIRYLLRKNLRLIFKPALPEILQSAVWASVLILLYSFAYPFKWHAMFLLDLISALKQFRALGRFAWVFYYIFSVYGVFVLYLVSRVLKQKNLKVTAYSIQILFFTVLLFEGFAYHKEVGPLVCKATNQFNKDLLYENYSKALKAIDTKKYQAILPLPYYHIGSEAQTRVVPDSTMKSSMYFAFHSKLPLIASSSARCSMTESRKLVQLLAPSFIKKEAMQDFKDKRPFLITYAKDPLDDDEWRLLYKAKKIYGNENLELFELNYDDLFANTSDAELKQFDLIKDSLYTNEGYLSDKKDVFIYHDDFEAIKSDTALQSKGALKGSLKDYIFILPRKALPLDEGKEYVASFWIYNRGSYPNTGMTVIEECNPDGSGIDWRQMYDNARCANIDGDWSLIELKFTLKKKGDLISIFTKGDDSVDKTVYRDNLLIRPADVNVYKSIETENGKTKVLFKNNFVIRN